MDSRQCQVSKTCEYNWSRVDCSIPEILKLISFVYLIIFQETIKFWTFCCYARCIGVGDWCFMQLGLLYKSHEIKHKVVKNDAFNR